MEFEVPSSKGMSVTIDSNTKERAEQILGDMGMNLTTYIVASIKALVREKRIPFSMVTQEYLTEQVIISKLAEAEKEAGDPKAARLDADALLGQMREQNGYKV